MGVLSYSRLVYSPKYFSIIQKCKHIYIYFYAPLNLSINFDRIMMTDDNDFVSAMKRQRLICNGVLKKCVRSCCTRCIKICERRWILLTLSTIIVLYTWVSKMCSIYSKYHGEEALGRERSTLCWIKLLSWFVRWLALAIAAAAERRTTAAWVWWREKRSSTLAGAHLQNTCVSGVDVILTADVILTD